MNTNPSATTVLCYGDSNTWGAMPTQDARFAADIRWTGKLQQLLGEDYYVIEEGMRGRTTDLDDPNEQGYGRNGRAYLVPCIESHNPIDIAIVMLGTNDTKQKFGRGAEQIATATEGLIQVIRSRARSNAGQPPRIIIVSPIKINISAPYHQQIHGNRYNQQSQTASEACAAALQKVAQQQDCDFLDAASVSGTGPDGIHLDTKDHDALAQALDAIVRK